MFEEVQTPDSQTLDSQTLMPKTYEFIAPLLKSAAGYLKQHYAPVPTEIADEVIGSGSRRVLITINGKTLRRAIQNSKDGEYFVLLGQQLMKELGIVFGDELTMQLELDPNPDFIDLGEEFTEVLELDEEAAARFFGFTLGKQRGLAHYVNSAKREETRIKRALEIAHKLKTYTLYGDKKPE